MAPSGSWHPPPSAVTTARSAATRRRARDRSSGCDRIARRPRPPPDLDRHDTLTGRRDARVDRDGGRDTRPEAQPPHARARPGRARRSRRRRACAAACRRCRESVRTWRGRKQRRSCAMRRTLLVPIAGASPRCASAASKSPTLVPVGEHQRVARILARQHGGDRRDRPAGRRTCPSRCGRRGRCLRASSASSISLTNSRLPPASDSGASCSRSPAVLIDHDLRRRAGASSNAATVCACQSASGLPRVPIRSVVIDGTSESDRLARRSRPASSSARLNSRFNASE